MDFGAGSGRLTADLRELTREWGAQKEVSLYLGRCQVDTPPDLVAATWRHVEERRKKIGCVVDFGAGDGRFAAGGKYTRYTGYEIDRTRSHSRVLPHNASIVNQCAFSETIIDADLCIGNPPFVRNQDLPLGWRQTASTILKKRTGVSLSGLANAWQYFFLLSLASTAPDGLVALVIPYEWVSRPTAEATRAYIAAHEWNVYVYRLIDTTFDSVLTTSSITIIDKGTRDRQWSYFEETASGEYRELPSPSKSSKGIIPYLSRAKSRETACRAIRGVSPGTQKVLTLTEGERVRAGLRVERDVVPCVTTLRDVPPGKRLLDKEAFDKFYRHAGQKCWLLRTDRKPSRALKAYLASIAAEDYQTSTCLEREEWWRFKMPDTPDILMATSFREKFPKGMKNAVGAKAVGGVCGIYNVPSSASRKILSGMGGIDLSRRVVAHSNGLKKLEINQLNSLIADLLAKKKQGR